ncbi:competence protein ComEA [Gammaproteobacteria bacterium]
MKKLRTWLSALILMGLSGLAFGASVDINSADATSIAKAIDGVGPVKAQAIVSYREKNGPFATVDDLTKVKGISKKIVDNNRANMTAGAAPAPATPAKPAAPAAPATPAAAK